VLLHHKLAPGSLAADAAERTNYFVQAAVTLATQQQQDLRHVAVIVPDVGDRPLGTGQPQSPALSGAEPEAAAAAAPRGAASAAGRSGSRGSLQAAAMAQAGAQEASILREIACMKLDLASQQPRLLSGTFGQLLQLLTALLGSSDQKAGTEATGTS